MRIITLLTSVLFSSAVFAGTTWNTPADIFEEDINTSTTTLVSLCSPPVISILSYSKPTYCLGTNGLIQLSGLSSSTSYTVDYLKEEITVSISLFSNSLGGLTIPNLTAGTYTNISVTNSAGCKSNTLTNPVIIGDPGSINIVLKSASNPTSCLGNNGIIYFGIVDRHTGYTANYLKDGVAGSSICSSVGLDGELFLTNLTAGTYTNISVTNLKGCQSNTLVESVTLGCNLNTTNFTKSENTIVFPNPATENVTVTISTEMVGSQFKLFDLTGRQLLSKSLQSETNIVNVSLLSKGTYIYNIEQNGQTTFSKKIVIE